MRVGMVDRRGSCSEGRRWAEDEAVREGSQMVGGWADWMGRKREREGWLSRHGRSGVDEVRGKGRGGWFPCLASRNRYAAGNLAPPTPPTPYVIAPQRPNLPPVRSASLFYSLPLSPLQLVQLPTHNPIRSSRCTNFIALTRVLHSRNASELPKLRTRTLREPSKRDTMM